MNSSQKTIVIVAVINLGLMLFFSPHDSLSLWRGGTPTLDGFCFVFDRHYNTQVNGAVLWLRFREPPQRETDQS